MNTPIQRCGEPSRPERWQALEQASETLVPALDEAFDSVAVGVPPSLLVGAADPVDIQPRAFAELGMPIRVRTASQVTYVARAETAADAVTRRTAHGEDVLLQRVTAGARDGRRYPTLSGELLTENPYPVSYLKAREGVCRLVLGFAEDIGRDPHALRFSPAHPDVMPDFSQPDDVLRNGQKEFLALGDAASDPLEMTRHPLKTAKADGTLQAVGGVVSLENQTVYPGVFRPGALTVTCAMLLRDHPFPLAPLLAELVARLADGCDAESWIHRVRFSVELPPAAEHRKPELWIEDVEQLERPSPRGDVPEERVLLTTRTALGLGAFRGTTDLLFVPPDRFDVSRSPEIAKEIAALDARFDEEGRDYVLVVPGRIGSTDRSLGIPLRWRDVSRAAVQVEVALEGFNVEESRGTHFFRELANEARGYLHVSLAQPGAELHWDRILALAPHHEGEFVRTVRLDDPPLVIQIDAAHEHGLLALGGS